MGCRFRKQDLTPTSSTGLGSWLHDPDVSIPFHVDLGYHGPKLLQDVLTALDLSVEVPEFCPLTVGRVEMWQVEARPHTLLPATGLPAWLCSLSSWIRQGCPTPTPPQTSQPTLTCPT